MRTCLVVSCSTTVQTVVHIAIELYIKINTKLFLEQIRLVRFKDTVILLCCSGHKMSYMRAQKIRGFYVHMINRQFRFCQSQYFTVRAEPSFEGKNAVVSQKITTRFHERALPPEVRVTATQIKNSGGGVGGTY